MSSLAELVDVVIGVDTHKHTHTAAVIDAATGAVLDECTVATDAVGYAELVAMADRHSHRRAWSIEGTGGYGAGLTRHLANGDEKVVELDRPNRPTRRSGAKSDPIDAVRAGREALGREHLAQPRAAGDRGALSVLLAARRSAMDGATVAQRQLDALVTAAPETLRARFRGQSTRLMLATASKLRVHASWDTETSTTARALRSLARRSQALETEARDHERAILTIVRAWRPDLLDQFGIGPIVAATVLCAWSHPGRCRNEAAFASLAGVAPDPGLVRADRAPPTQPLRRPSTQPRPSRHRRAPPPPRPHHPRLRRTTTLRRQNRPRDQALPQALHRTPALPPARTTP